MGAAMTRVRTWGLWVLLGTGCAPVTVRVPGPDQIPALESRLESEPGSTWTRVRLGAAYRERGDAERAVEVLEPVAGPDGGEAPAVLLLGAALEDLGRFADARDAYSASLATAPAPRLRRQLENRLESVRRAELRAAVRSAVSSEQALAAQPPPPMTVGVFPFLVESADTSLRPLSRGLAELISTDLALTDRLRVVERSRLQLLLDELRLAASGRVRPETGARAGRLVGAANIVQGRLEGTQAELRVQAAVVEVARPDAAADAALREAGAIDGLFDIEKNLVFAVYERLGVQLTVAERERIGQHATRSVQALLAFGFALEAMDAGRFRLAASEFGRALTFDPGFELARQRQAEALRLDEAEMEGTDDLADEIAAEFRLDLNEYEWVNTRFADVEALIPDPLPRDPAAEALGGETPIPASLLRIVIRRPGGRP